MQLAIFGIENDGLNLVANLFVMGLVVVWLALIVWTYFDARRRIEDPVLVACATAASLFPYIGTFVYSILRPPEFLEDAKERELEIKAAELRVRQLAELSCPNCQLPGREELPSLPPLPARLKDPCESCGKPVDPRWALCPYCETALPGASRQRQQKREPQRKPGKAGKPGKRAPGKPGRAAKQRPAGPPQRGGAAFGAAHRVSAHEPARAGRADPATPARPRRRSAQAARRKHGPSATSGH